MTVLRPCKKSKVPTQTESECRGSCPNGPAAEWRKKMEENNIHIINEDCAPISEDSVMNISISKMPSKRKKKSYNTGFGRNADTSRGFYEQYGRKVMHIDS